jgi:hypothetical protein
MTSFFSVDADFGNVFLGITAISGGATYSNNVIGGYACTFGVSSNFTQNVAIGPITLASAQRVDSTVAIGQAAGSLGRSISSSVLLGVGAGYSISGFASNVAIGHSAAQYHRNATNNVFLGYGAGYGTAETIASNNTTNTAIGDGVFRFSSENTRNVVVGARSMNYSSNVSGCIVLGNDAGPTLNCSQVMSIGHRNLSGFSGQSNIFLGNGIGTGATASNTIAIGHGVDVSGLSGTIVIGTVSQTYFFADTSKNQVILGGRQGPYALDPSGNVAATNASVGHVVINGPLYNPYILHLSLATDTVLPIAPYIFIDQSSTATRLYLDTNVSEAITSNTYNFDVVIGNNTSNAINLCGSFYSVNVPLSNTETLVLSGNTIRKFKRMMFVNPPQYYIGYLQ